MKEEILTQKKKKMSRFFRVIETLGFENSKVVIFFNNSESSSMFSPMDVGFKLNHVNHCVF